MSEKVRVVVVISGGVCQAVYAGQMVEVVIHDEDDAADDREGYKPEINPPDVWGEDAQNIWDAAVKSYFHA